METGFQNTRFASPQENTRLDSRHATFSVHLERSLLGFQRMISIELKASSPLDIA